MPARGARFDRSRWSAAKHAWTDLFGTRTRDEWATVFAGSDACVAPVLTFDEAAAHPQVGGRGSYLERDGLLQPGVAPRFGETPGEPGAAPAWPGQHTDEVLAELGLDRATIDRLRAAGAVA